MDEAKSTQLDSETLLGTVVGARYRIDSVLGEGSMGIVYLAEHTHMKKQVALKVMRAEFLDDESAIERFQREAQAAAHIDHANVCTATDFGLLDDEKRYFLVMEFLDGESLGQRLEREGRLSPEEAVSITRQNRERARARSRTRRRTS